MSLDINLQGANDPFATKDTTFYNKVYNIGSFYTYNNDLSVLFTFPNLKVEETADIPELAFTTYIFDRFAIEKFISSQPGTDFKETLLGVLDDIEGQYIYLQIF